MELHARLRGERGDDEEETGEEEGEVDDDEEEELSSDGNCAFFSVFLCVSLCAVSQKDLFLD